MRTERLLRQARIRAAKYTLAFDDDFWCQYYGNVRRANRTLLDLHIHRCEINAIEFILRTSPSFVYGRIRQTLQSLELINFDLFSQLQHLYSIQRLIVHRKHNPLYLEHGAHRMQHGQPKQVDRAKNRSDEKEKRMQYKSLYGENWQMRSSYRYSSDNTMRQEVNYTHAAGIFCNTYPPRWTVTPLSAMVSLHVYRSRKVVVKLDHLLGTYRGKVFGVRCSHVEHLRHTMTVVLWDIADLLDELAALRYYRLHHFPDSALPGEIEVGTRILTALKMKKITPTRMGSSNSMKEIKSPPVSHTRGPYEGLKTTPSHSHKDVNEIHTDIRQATPTNTNYPGLPLRKAWMHPNSKGLFRWSQWNGGDWTLEYMKPYTRLNSVVAAATAKKNYSAVMKRLCDNSLRNVDAYLMAHYKSQYNAFQLTDPLFRHLINSTIVDFLLRTSPPRIRVHVSSQFIAMESLNYTLRLDVEQLRRIQIALASVPENPLFFKSLAMRHRSGLERSELKTKMRVLLKNHRTRSKTETDLQGLPRAYRKETDHVQALAKTMRDVARMDSTFWHSQHPFSIAEPFQGIIILLQTRFRRTSAALRELRMFITETTSPDMWHQVDQITERLADCRVQIELLTSDLTAIRYYRAHHFPASVSEEELALGRSLYEHFRRTLETRIGGKSIYKTTTKSPLMRRTYGDKGGRSQGEKDHGGKGQGQKETLAKCNESPGVADEGRLERVAKDTALQDLM
jgi:hypothetical protein